MEAAARYAKAFDGLLCSLFKAAESTMIKAGTWQNVGLAAVGSYGRNELGYHSDLDVRLISASKPEKVRAVAEALLYPLWDAGLSIGHQVVMGGDLLDLAKTDLPTATTLLDWRVLTGDKTSSEKMLTRAFEGIFGIGNIKKFLDRLEIKAHERSERFGGSVYLLEPDVKNGHRRPARFGSGALGRARSLARDRSFGAGAHRRALATRMATNRGRAVTALARA